MKITMMKFTGALACLALAGCASTTPDHGFGEVAAEARRHLNITPQRASGTDATDARERIAHRTRELLAAPLTAEAAVELALLNNAGLQARYYALDLAEADWVSASRLPNPGFSFGRLKRGEGQEIDRGLSIDLLRMLTLPAASAIERRRFARERAAVVQDVLKLAADTRRAYYLALAADQSLAYARDVLDAAEASAELARRMAGVGNWSRLQRAREQGFYADAAMAAARAELATVSAREKLARLMGISGREDAFRLAERLPELPAAAEDRPDVEQRAMATRLDIQAGKADVETLARNLGLARATRFINVLELGLARNSDSDGTTERGYEIRLELPIFDAGQARTAKAEALYGQALARVAQTAHDARSEVREAYLAYRLRYDMAKHYRDEIVPLKKQISDENLLRYNGMLIGVFDLLADARAQIAGVSGYIEALRDFWIAQAELERAMLGPSDGTALSTTTATEAPAGAAH